MMEKLINGRRALRENNALIHCITSPIAINDCANIILAIGARPIMAEHPCEVEGITRIAAGLSVSLANITDARAQSIMIAGKTALENKISSVIDLVGVTCSEYRMNIALQYIEKCKPDVIKGNASEILAIAKASSIEISSYITTENVIENSGVDVAPKDKIKSGDKESMDRMCKIVKKLAQRYKTTILVTGEVDIVGNTDNTYYIENGSELMAKITGTGCILSCMIAAGFSALAPIDSVLLMTSMLGIAGEIAKEKVISDSNSEGVGLGSYHCRLIDELSYMTDKTFTDRSRISKYY